MNLYRFARKTRGIFQSIMYVYERRKARAVRIKQSEF